MKGTARRPLNPRACNDFNLESIDNDGIEGDDRYMVTLTRADAQTE